MNKIIFPLKLRMRGDTVGDLQDGLQLLLDTGFFELSDADRQGLEERLRGERATTTYERTTGDLVVLFQRQRRLDASGDVDEPTANALNAALEELGAFRPVAADQQRVVAGQVRREDGEPLAAARVRAIHVSDESQVRLGEDTTDAEGRYTIRFASLPGAGAVDLRVVIFDADGKRQRESEIIRSANPMEIVDLVAPSAELATYYIEGRVASRMSAAVSGLRVVIMDKRVGGDVELAEAVTDDRGAYQTTFASAELQRGGKVSPDLQARVFTDDTFRAASVVRYNASNRESLDVLLDEEATSALRSEHETLTGGLADHFGGRLADLQETDERQDITYLANKTGWDARAVALASLADQFSARTTNGRGDADIEPAFFYALFRAGLPANEDALYRTDSKTTEEIWRAGIAHGIIPSALEDRVPARVERFQKLAAGRVLDAPAVVGISSLREVISVSLGDNAQVQSRLAEMYARHQGDLPKFWEAVRDTLGEPAEKRLRLDGQLAYLTLNNAPLIRKLHAAAGRNGVTDTRNLAAEGYYQPAEWQSLLANDPIPPEIPGENVDAKRASYAEMLAAQVRLSFPTAVVAQMVKSGETPLANGIADQVHGFLSEHHGRFEIGIQPVEQFIAKNDLRVAAAVTNEVKRIQRVYQITPNDDAMNALLKKGVDSAYAVVRYDRAEFIRTFKEDVGGETSARRIHARSEQVYNAVLNIAISYLSAKVAPGIGAHSSPRILDPEPMGPAPHAGDVIAYSTLERLFGEMDFCACEHCRSILSPAAYLVDLLLFLDRPAPSGGFANPKTVLLDRRPDIKHLPLTCENTNTPLPYIDLVNETLEYFITNGLSLAAYTGHNTTDEVTPEQLLANPQFVSDRAYEVLAGRPAQAGDPPPLLPPTSTLPFHQLLENLRLYFDRFNAPLPAVMEALRTDDNLDRANANEYAWRDILMEELRLSRAEYALLTDRTLTLQQLYGFAPATSDADVLTELAKAKRFARRLDISYEDLIEILKSRFVNPHSTLIPKLERLGVPFSTLKKLKEGAITDELFDAALAPHLDEAEYGGDIKAWVRDEDNYASIMGLITLANPTDDEDLCSFDNLELRYANPDNDTNALRAIEFVRLIRFIRLWKKLGWTIEQTDKAIIALYPPNQTPNDPDDAVNLQRLDAGFLTFLPRLGVLSRVMGRIKFKLKKDLLPLLACFAPLDTHGAASLYRQMFLNPTLLAQDGAFADDGYGNFLTDNAQKLLEHGETLRAAFLLTDDELSQITTALGYDDSTLLDLDNVTAIFRQGWLARKLKLSIKEFLLLTESSNIDQFAAPDPPEPPFLRFIEIVDRLRAASLKPEQALYLIWNHDISGRSAPTDDELMGLARILRTDLITIESEFALIDDPDGEIARARMALVYGSEATDLFFGYLSNSVVSDVEYVHNQAILQQEIVDASDGIAYDNLRKRLSYNAGVMTNDTRDALQNVAGVTQAFKDAVGELHNKTRTFFERYPDLLPLYEAYAGSNESPEKKRTDLLASVLPELKLRRKRQQALQVTSAAGKSDLGFATALLDDATVLHAASDVTRPVLDDLTAVETTGLSAQFFFRDTATGAMDKTSDAEANLSYAPGSNALPANPRVGSAISGIWSGYLEAPENGFYNLIIEADSAATVTLHLAGKPVDMGQSRNVWSNSEPIELRAGTLHAISLTVERLRDTLTVRWETSGRGREIIPARHLYSATLADHLKRAYVRFLKAGSLAAELKLTAAEIAYLASHADYQIGGQGWLNSLAFTSRAGPATSVALLKAFEAVLDFARLKADLSPDDERLLTVLEDPVAATENPDSLLFTLTRWQAESLDSLLTRFGMVDDGNADRSALKDLRTFDRVHHAYVWAKTLGVAASVMIKTCTNEPAAATVRDLQAALRARYDEEDWLNVLQPINDKMRAMQRDALVAYILHQMRADAATEHIDTSEKLFEYFLMDVAMEPCMMTSRVRHALSSIQLFIERSLLGLEPRVAASSLNAVHWVWMKRYRVWEANRKVFLWPENWLDPELRDDQSPFFKEAMSELLQSDITEESASMALLRYLAKLEEVAKLEPCGIHYAEYDAAETADDVAYVVARTAGANRKYFHRKRDGGSWSPWEQIKLDIEDNPVIPVLWRDRLFLFWLRIIKKAPGVTPSPPPAGTDLQDLDASKAIQADPPYELVQAVLCWSEYYNGEWQPARTSDVSTPLGLGAHPTAGKYVFDRSKLKLSVMFWTKGAVRIIVSTEAGAGASFFLHNTYSAPELRTPKKDQHFAPKRLVTTGGTRLHLTYPNSDVSHPVLKTSISDRVVAPLHPLQGKPWDAPFFYEDGRHVFYVTTAGRITLVPDWNNVVVAGRTPVLTIEPPPLLVRPFEIIPDFIGPLIRQPGFGVDNPAVIEQYVTEDLYINQGIGTPGTVTFGDREIGPAGSFAMQ